MCIVSTNHNPSLSLDTPPCRQVPAIVQQEGSTPCALSGPQVEQEGALPTLKTS